MPQTDTKEEAERAEATAPEPILYDQAVAVMQTATVTASEYARILEDALRGMAAMYAMSQQAADGKIPADRFVMEMGDLLLAMYNKAFYEAQGLSRLVVEQGEDLRNLPGDAPTPSGAKEGV